MKPQICDLSVIIPVYNRAHLLRWPLASIAAQTLHPFEVIVVDDCSAPQEAQAIRTIVDEFSASLKVRLLVTDRNGGQSYARNRGIKDAGGRYLAFLDSDDLWLPGKLERQMSAIEVAQRSNDRPVFSATGSYWVDSDGKILQRKPCHTRFDAERIQTSNFIPMSSVVVEASVVRELGGFAEDIRTGSDWDFWLRLLGRVQFVALAEPHTIYVLHEGGRLSENGARSIRVTLLTRRRHMRVETRENARFYRKLAQALQAQGKMRTAKKLYLRSIALQQRTGWRRRVVEAGLQILFSVKPMPPARNRWQDHIDDPMAHERDPQIRARWAEDQRIISALMRIQGATKSPEPVFPANAAAALTAG